MALSSIASASSFFSLAFSSSSAFSRRASDTSRPPYLRLPLVEGRAADPVLAAHVRRLRPRLLLPQDPDDLLFREPARLHVHPLSGDGLYPFLEEFSGLRSKGVIIVQSAAPTSLKALQYLLKNSPYFGRFLFFKSLKGALVHPS